MKNVLVTGGAGFIGSNFIPYFLKQHSDYKIINIDSLTYAGNPENVKISTGKETYEFVKGDITNRTLLEELFDKYLFAGVIHFAAESHVDNSISSPEKFIQTNIFGTFQLLDVARKKWMRAPFLPKENTAENRFLHVSTDEVYGSLGAEGLFTENTAYAPNSPYSASKAGSDMLVRSYFHTYGLNVVTTNCSNNYGPRQHDEKLIPTIIRNAINQSPIPVYGDGKNIRDWLFVEDHCSGIDLAFNKGRAGETYNIGGHNEKTNNDIVNAICELLDIEHPRSEGSYKNLITFVKDRAGHDKRYAIDPTKIETELKWHAKETFESGIRKTIRWYIEKYTSREN